MADVQKAIKYVLLQEDSTLSGIITKTADGKHTRFGIDEHFHPELTNCLFYGSMGSVAALRIAENIYNEHYAQPLCIAEISNQDIANKLLSLGVNCGVITAARMLQDVLDVPGDGHIGPLTLDAIDRAKPDEVLEQFKLLAIDHYERLVSTNPSLGIYLNGWIARANA